MEISARTDYGIRALAELAAAGGGPRTVGELAAAQDIPPRFLQNIMLQFRRRGLVRSLRGAEGGYRLARPAAEITLAQAFRALEGPLAGVRGERPDQVAYLGSAAPLVDVWLAVRVALREVLEEVSLEALVSGELPDAVARMLAQPGAWETH